MVAGELGEPRLVLLVLFSLLVSYLVVFEAEFGDQHGRRWTEGVLQRPLTETVASYVVALLVCGARDLARGRLPGRPVARRSARPGRGAGAARRPGSGGGPPGGVTVATESQSRRSAAQMVTTTVCVLLIALVCGAILYEGYAAGDDDPARVEVAVDAGGVEQRGDLWYVPFEVANGGDETIEEIWVVVEGADGSGQTVVESETTVQLLGESERAKRGGGVRGRPARARADRPRALLPDRRGRLTITGAPFHCGRCGRYDPAGAGRRGDRARARRPRRARAAVAAAARPPPGRGAAPRAVRRRRHVVGRAARALRRRADPRRLPAGRARRGRAPRRLRARRHHERAAERLERHVAGRRRHRRAGDAARAAGAARLGRRHAAARRRRRRARPARHRGHADRRRGQQRRRDPALRAPRLRARVGLHDPLRRPRAARRQRG